ncbi:hypothetical protein MLD38_034533 [Melastoma candidum]|uniref:Uncharacterized protein n=1 Tax=Melastoma candidum TaxID=119954 RepID=A0ACB9MAQ7_9MYRT|nr:hypothetical protein MLD38_034533 [Melastoma candidum]
MVQSGDIDTRPECCMCGDSGLPHELYRCRVCLFRSQHRYCSNQYPRADDGTYQVCNWCLIPAREGSSDPMKKAAGNNSSNSISSRYKTPKSIQDDDGHNKRLRKGTISGLDSRNGPDCHSNGNGRVKKACKAQATTPRKQIITRGTMEEKLRGMKPETENRRGRPVFRNKVRRYKLLHEVSC